MSKPIEEILAAKPEARPRIYAYAMSDQAHAGLLKVGQSRWDSSTVFPKDIRFKQRGAEPRKTDGKE